MLAHDIKGEGEPLLLIPGMTVRDAWDPVLAPLAARRRVIRVDYPGFGGSPQTSPPVPAATALAVVELLDELELERVKVVGHSLGGWVALELAKLGRAEAVLAFAPAGLWRKHSPRMTDLRLRLGMAAARFWPRWVFALALRSPLHRWLALRDQSAHPLRVRPEWAMGLIDAGRAARTWPQLFRATRVERFTGGEAIEVPVRVVWGDKDRIALAGKSRFPDELPSHADIETWDDVGHVTVWDAPDRVVDACLAL